MSRDSCASVHHCPNGDKCPFMEWSRRITIPIPTAWTFSLLPPLTSPPSSFLCVCLYHPLMHCTTSFRCVVYYYMRMWRKGQKTKKDIFFCVPQRAQDVFDCPVTLLPHLTNHLIPPIDPPQSVSSLSNLCVGWPLTEFSLKRWFNILGKLRRLSMVKTINIVLM